MAVRGRLFEVAARFLVVGDSDAPDGRSVLRVAKGERAGTRAACRVTRAFDELRVPLSSRRTACRCTCCICT